ncbi:MAG: hypothetical protein QOI12_3682 [Alphaproteobacteria bacterium]|jgi:hypothetical protein|nr:hypothetical protein [Alphaproteobacteria bacterium]
MEDIVSIYREDLGAAPTEFPITVMSETLALALHRLLLNPPSRFARAVDVGTGTGIHAAIMVACGVPKVLAVDLSCEALEGARSRFDRLNVAHSLVCAECAPPTFRAIGVDDLALEEDAFDLSLTNPPSFFQPPEFNGLGLTPVEYGVYDGVRADPSDPKRAFLYRYLKLVDERLAPGGVTLCTWPGLERRLVHDLTSPDHPIVHPTALLEQWFGWEIGGPPASDWRGFYNCEAHISHYGLGERFLESLSRDLNRGGYYSDLVRPPIGRAPTLLFRFGVLALRRDLRARERFSLLPLDLRPTDRGALA